jgi:DNA integrity scanning protein DisA with diadenylate cyclase activity
MEVTEELSTVPSADFSYQFSAQREYLKIEKKIFHVLTEISNKYFLEKKSSGALIVYGNFYLNENHIIEGMRQIGVNPIQKFLSFGYANFENEITSLLEENNDGAFIVNKDGQILGAKIYLSVDHPSLEVPEGCGTRHITAASFSKRKNILSVFTLSEENLSVRKWKDGVFVDQFFPSEKEETI